MFATSNASVLSGSVQQIKDAISDFRTSLVEQEALHVLERIVSLFDSEPLGNFLTSALPSINFRNWWNKSEEGLTGVLLLPPDLHESIAIRVELCRVIKKENDVLIHFTNRYCRSQGLSYFERFATKVLDPLVRDIDRLIALRPVSPILLEAMRNFPPSGDDVLDEKLQEACRKFKDPAPQSLQDAVEKLWDSLQRLKTLDHQDKKKSIFILLEKTIDEPKFRDSINKEMLALTEIGDNFQIRHFETNKPPLNQKQLEYLFHRLYSLIRFLLLARNKNQY
jgi:hypothetical protein